MKKTNDTFKMIPYSKIEEENFNHDIKLFSKMYVETLISEIITPIQKYVECDHYPKEKVEYFIYKKIVKTILETYNYVQLRKIIWQQTNELLNEPTGGFRYIWHSVPGTSTSWRYTFPEGICCDKEKIQRNRQILSDRQLYNTAIFYMFKIIATGINFYRMKFNKEFSFYLSEEPYKEFNFYTGLNESELDRTTKFEEHFYIDSLYRSWLNNLLCDYNDYLEYNYQFKYERLINGNDEIYVYDDKLSKQYENLNKYGNRYRNKLSQFKKELTVTKAEDALGDFYLDKRIIWVELYFETTLTDDDLYPEC